MSTTERREDRDDGRMALVACPARPDEVGRARRTAVEVAERAGFDAERVADIALAVTEVCANAVVHAYRDADPGSFEMRCNVRDGRMEVVVTDTGRGLAPRPDSPGAGFGLPIVAALATSLVLGTADGGGTEVRMTFSL